MQLPFLGDNSMGNTWLIRLVKAEHSTGKIRLTGHVLPEQAASASISGIILPLHKSASTCLTLHLARSSSTYRRDQ